MDFIYLLVCEHCVWCVCMWVGGGQCVPVCPWRAEESVVSCFITFLPYLIETGSDTVSGARLAASNPGNPPVRIPTGLGLHAYSAVPSFLDYSHWGFLSYWAIMPASHKFQMKNKHLFSSGDHIKIDCHIWQLVAFCRKICSLTQMENFYKLFCGLNVKCLKQVHVLTAWSLAGGGATLRDDGNFGQWDFARINRWLGVYLWR